MHSMKRNARRRAHPLALRFDRAHESRFPMALITLMSFATLSVLATTTALTHHHASSMAALLGQ